MMRARAWTIGLLIVSTIIAFILGTLFGALMAGQNEPHRPCLVAIFMTLSAIPYYLLACSSSILCYGWHVCLSRGRNTAGCDDEPELVDGADIGRHAFAGCLIVLVGIAPG